MRGMFVFILNLFIIQASAQGINFQGVARGANGTIIAGSKISLRLSIVAKSADGIAEYVETRTVQTNAQGIFSIALGDSSNYATVGNFKNVAWKDGQKYLKVEMDPTGGTSYITMGTTMLQNVPFSFYSLGVDAANVNGVLSVAKGGTGFTTLAELKTALQVQKIDTASINAKIDTKLSKQDTVSLSNRINSKLSALDSISFAKDIRVNGIRVGIGPGNILSNVVAGSDAFAKNTTGFQNNALGSMALNANTVGNRNNAFGTNALGMMTTGTANSAFGNFALGYIVSGNENSAFGRMALLGIKQGNYNTAFGNQALANDTIGNLNIAVGYKAGAGLKNGNNNILIGNYVGQNAAYSNVNNKLFIGNLDSAGSSISPLMYGAFDSAYLTINGNLNVTGSINAAGGLSSILDTAGNIRLGKNVLAKNQSVPNNNFAAMNGKNYNIGIGDSALYNNTIGIYNIAIGNKSLAKNTEGGFNTAIGYGALLDMGSDSSTWQGWANTAIGSTALMKNKNGTANIAVGSGVLELGTTGNFNAGYGMDALHFTNGDFNTGIGDSAMSYLNAGNNNTAIGYRAGLGLQNGSNNIFIGNAVGANSQTTNVNNILAIDNSDTTKPLIYGEFVNNKLTINGDLVVTGKIQQITPTNTTGANNTVMGANALNINTTGAHNTSLGTNSLLVSTTGNENTAVGSASMYNNRNGSYNVAIGVGALYSNVANTTSTAVGYNAMQNANNSANVIATYNTAVGYEALKGSSTAANNIGQNNTSIGFQTLYVNTSGSSNTALGSLALTANTTGQKNTAIGYQSLQTNTTGSGVAAFGSEAGKANTTGINNTYIGTAANTTAGSLSNSTAIGYNAQVTASNQIRLGDANVTEVKTSGLVTSGKGFLAQGITAATRDAIVAPEAGLMIFCKDCGDNGELEVFNGSTWTNMVGGTIATSNAVLTGLSTGQVTYFQFNGNLTDASGLANTGTVTSTLSYTSDRFGQANKSVTLATINDIIATTNQFNNPQTIAYSFWFKASQSGQFIGFNNGINTHGGNWDRVISLDANGYINYYIFNGAERNLKGNVNLKDNAWHHCAVNFSAAGTVIYIDGSVAAQDATFNLSQNYNGYFRIGGLQTGAANTLSLSSNIGSIDDVRIYNRILTSNEVSYLRQH